ncbi:MAG: hypothetical protein KGI97_08200, partial [Alphaproteobacteria bacterium]|nr:hypothetical protein [Alphaproteobacteria bacterium]
MALKKNKDFQRGEAEKKAAHAECREMIGDILAIDKMNPSAISFIKDTWNIHSTLRLTKATWLMMAEDTAMVPDNAVLQTAKASMQQVTLPNGRGASASAPVADKKISKAINKILLRAEAEAGHSPAVDIFHACLLDLAGRLVLNSNFAPLAGTLVGYVISDGCSPENAGEANRFF